MTKSLRLLAFIVAFLSYPRVHAALSPISIAIVPGVQFPPEDFSITGARISALVGKHRNIYGIDLGLVGNITEQSFVGIGVSGLFNLTEGETTAVGLQLAGLTNINKNKTHVFGLQVAALLNSNEAAASVAGLQVALVNLAPFTQVYGAQLGLYNRAQDVYGFQMGVVNRAKSLHGIQIGLLNFNETGTFFVSPILNIGF